MEAKQLHKLRRTDLFELLVSQAEEIESLQAQVKYLQAKLDQKELAMTEAGSLAEASLKINKVFEAAQAAADQYLENVKRLAEEKEETE